MKLLLRCPKTKPYLVKGSIKPMHTLDTNNPYNFNWKLVDKGFSDDRLNGKIIAECDFEVDKIEYKHIKERDKFGILHNESWYEYKGLNVSHYNCDLASRSGFDDSHSLFNYLFEYLIDKEGYPQDGYAIHIKNLHIFDTPKELSDYRTFFTDKDRLTNFVNAKNCDFVSIRLSEYISEVRGTKTLEKVSRNMQKIVNYKGNNKYEYTILMTLDPNKLCRILNGEQTTIICNKVSKEMLWRD